MYSRLQPRKRWLFLAGALFLLVIESYVVASPWIIKRETASWMQAHIDDHSQIVSDTEGQEVQQLIAGSDPEKTWKWKFVPSIEIEPPQGWLAQGNHYLLIDERTLLGSSFASRIQNLIDQGATLLYESSPLIPYGARQAVLWPFKTDYPLDATFDNQLTLIGFNMQIDSQQRASLLLHWHVRGKPAIAYHVFLHLYDPASGKPVAQADTALSNGTFLANQWHPNEIVFEAVSLPANMAGVYQLHLGLYDLDSGQRATVHRDGQPDSDEVVVSLSIYP